MRVVVGSDAHGWVLKARVKAWLLARGCEVVDGGAESDVPDARIGEYCDAASGMVSRGEAERGVLVCMSGGYMTIRANKWPGVRAVVGLNAAAVVHDRGASDVNVLGLAATYGDYTAVEEMLGAFLDTPFEPLERRVRRLGDLDRFMA